MKKLVLAAFAAVLLPTLVLAQGTVSFTTSDFANHRFLMQPDLAAAPAGTTAQLWWSADNVQPYTQIGANTVTVNGWITAGVTATTGAATPAGSTGWFYVYGEILNPAGYVPAGLYWGNTPNFQNATGNPGATPPGTPADLTGWTSPVLLAIPEPSTIALAGLGLASLLIFRRRK